MEVLYILLVLLLVTRSFGEVAVRFHQPALVGELIAGIALGAIVAPFASTFPILSDLTEDKVFLALTDLGVFFLMLYGGIEMRPKDLAKASVVSFFVALFGMFVPLTLGFTLAWFLLPESDYRIAQALFLGTALSITAVPVAIRVLMDLERLETRVGKVIVSAAIFDDILSLIVLAVLTAMVRTGEPPGVSGMLILTGQIVLFFVVTFALGLVVLPRLMSLIARFKAAELELTTLLVVALGFAVLAEVLNLHFILGAFMAGLFFERQGVGRDTYADVKKKVSGITTGFLAPIFFASIGFHLDVSAVFSVPGFLSLLIVLAFASKLLGAGLPAYFLGLSKREAVAVGVGMSARGAVELIIADIALRAGLFEHPDPPPPLIAHLFSAVVIVAIVTTVAIPVVLRQVVQSEQPADESTGR